MIDIESHPLQPFLPAEGRMLFLGSFPPPRTRWSMEFFYPNWTNDFWRIMGIIFFADRRHFEMQEAGAKAFDRGRITEFCRREGLAFFDTARRVRRLKGNASDADLEIVEATDVGRLLEQMPQCCSIVTTGSKASEALREQLSEAAGTDVPTPAIGHSTTLEAYGRRLQWWRMPSSSRAYPLAIEKKAERYAVLFAARLSAEKAE